MSYKLNKVTFMNKKTPINEVNLNVRQSSITNIFVRNKNQFKFIKKILTGKEKIESGRYQIDGQDIIGKKFIKSKVEVIGNDKWIDRLLPPKLVLNLSLLFDINFLRKARIENYNKKFDYLSFKNSKADLDDMKLRKDIDKVILDFVNDGTQAEINLLEEYFSKINALNDEKVSMLFADYYVQIQFLAKQYYSIKENLANAELLLTFYQVIWDKIYEFNELRNSCTCEYNVKESLNKYLKKNKDKFFYKQTTYVIKKQLKFLNIRISEVRILIYELKRDLRRTNRQLNIELNKFHQKHSTDKEKINKLQLERDAWNKFSKDLRDTFETKQKSIFFDTIPTEAENVRRIIIFAVHKYHEKVFSNKNQIEALEKFKESKKYYKNQIVSVYKQATVHTNKTLEKLGIKFDWYLKNGFRLSSVNMIYLKILKAINLKRDNIVFANKLHLLSKTNIEQLRNVLYKIKEEYPELTFIIISDSPYEILSLSPTLFAPDVEGRLIELTIPDFYIKNARLLIQGIFANKNTFGYIKRDDGLVIDKKAIWKTTLNTEEEQGYLFINPYLFNVVKKGQKINDDELIFKMKIKQSSRFIDSNMYFGVTEWNRKVYFYSQYKLEDGKTYAFTIGPKAIIEEF